MSIANIEKIINDLIRENKDIKNKLDILIERTNEPLCSTKNLELVAAKIIKEIKEETRIVSIEERLTAFPSNGKYSYPNFEVGNAELGSSGNPIAVSWPSVQKSSEEKLKLLQL